MMDDFGVGRRIAPAGETAAANRSWWDAEAQGYYLEHGEFLGDAQLMWGPEGWTEDDLHVLGDVRGKQVLEIGAGAGQGSRWARAHGATVVATDLSIGMLRQAQAIDRPTADALLPLAQCDAVALPFADQSFDVVFTAYGAVPFVADSATLMREAARVLRPGGLFAFSTTHPIRWAFPDVPGPAGLTAHQSYFDRTPYVEQGDDGHATYVEHHRTMGDRIAELVAAGFVVTAVLEPPWRESNTQEWGGWSPLRGQHLPGTAIFVARTPER